MEQMCGTMWSTYQTNSHGDKFNGRRHGCMFPKGHRGGICMCHCGSAHHNMDRKQDESASVPATV